MKKNVWNHAWGYVFAYASKNFLKMKLTLCLTLFSVLGALAADSYSQTTKLTLDLKNTAVRDVLGVIENQSEFFFLYSEKIIDVNRKINLDLRDCTIDKVLRKVFEGTDVNFTVKGKQIVLTTPESNSPTGFSEQQRKNISGIVTDSLNLPLPGVTVLIIGTTTGKITDSNGNFSFVNVPDDAVLQFSFVGMKTQEIETIGKTTFSIVMKEEAINLKEIAVIGYGTINKKDITGSITSITSESFEGVKAGGITQMLQGRAPGVFIKTTGGNPADNNTRIRIRGANSLSGDNDPLIVVDGNYNGSYNILDVESIEILKDASATAIYGSRGANGVILITTKKANSETFKISARANLSFDFLANKYDKMNALEYAEYNNSVGYTAYTNEQMDAIALDPEGTDWQDEIYQTAVNHGYAINMSGGSKKSKFFLSSNYNESNGLLKDTWSKNLNFRINLDFEMNKWISFNFQGNAGTNERKNAGLGKGGDKTSNPILESVLWSPVETVFLEDGITYRRNDTYGSRGISPVLLLKKNKRNSSGFYDVLGEVKIKIFRNLELRSKASTKYSTSNYRYYDDPLLTGSYANAGQSASYPITDWWTVSTLNYTKTILFRHHVSAMVGFEEMKNAVGSFLASGTNLTSPSVGWDNLGNASTKNATSSYSNSAMRSYFARGTYNYGSKYYLTATWRADGSSKFGANNKFGYFPSFGLGWRISEESFLKETGIFENLKLRGGWGITGSQAISSYATFSPLTGGNSWNGYMYGTSTTFVGQKIGLAGNPNLQWEETRQTDIGLDVSVLQGRLTGAFDYYLKNTSKLLTKKSMPYIVGGGTTLVNLGEIENKGFEIGINYLALDHKDLKYDLTFNYSNNRNKIKNIGDATILYGDTYASGILSLSPFVMMPGYALGTIYGYKYLGIWQEADAAEAAEYGQSPGDYRYEDLNGDYAYGSEDYQVIGDCNPDFTWGINNHFTYKNLEFGFLIEGVHGQETLNMSYALATHSIDISRAISLREARDRWSVDNPNAEFAKIGTTNKLQVNSSQFVQDASFVKLRNVTIGYRVPQTLTKIGGDIQFAVSAQNILCFTKYKGYDPEISSSSSTSGSDHSSGADFFAYPNPRSVTFSVSLDF